MSEEQLPYHERFRLIKLGLLPREAIKKERKPIPRQSKKKLAEEKKQKEAGIIKPPSKLALDKWFDDIIRKYFFDGERRGAICMECKSYIHPDYARHSIAHLLPKKIFKSVATHPLNYLILGAGCGCHYKTDRVDKFIQMKIWPEAARRIKIMLPLLPIDELRHISNQLLIALNNE